MHFGYLELNQPRFLLMSYTECFSQSPNNKYFHFFSYTSSSVFFHNLPIIKYFHKIIRFLEKMSPIYFSLSLLFLYCVPVSSNYLLNNGFETPDINIILVTLNYCTSWTGNNFQLKGPGYSTLGFDQFIELQKLLSNGYISQLVTLPQDGLYNFSFYVKGTTLLNSNVMQIIWNGQVVSTYTPTSTSITFESVEVIGILGINNLTLNEIGNTVQLSGTKIDQLSVTYIGPVPPPIIINETVIENNTSSTNTTINQTQYNITSNNTTTNSTINSTLQQNITQQVEIVAEPVQNQEEPMLQQEIEKKNQHNNSSFFGETGEIAASAFISIPVNQVPSFKYAMIFIQDLWLYYYDNRSYSGIINQMFKAAARIESMKFDILSQLINTQFIHNLLPFSDYTNFTRKNFLEIEGSDWVVIHAVFPYFIYTIPSNILFCIFLYLFFHLIYNYKISLLIRRFYFIRAALFQMLLEGNIAYFSFICFGNLTAIPFSFTFYDKIGLSTTLLFFFFIITFVFSFYFLMGKYLQKQSCYFIYCYYRCQGTFVFLTIALTRTFLKGAIHFFFHSNYTALILTLSLLQITTFLITIKIQHDSQIFISKTMFCCYLVYLFSLVFLNISLFLEKNTKMFKGVADSFVSIQEIMFFSLLICSGIMMIFDLVPYEVLKSKDDFEEELQQLGQRIHETVVVENKQQQEDKKLDKKQQKQHKKSNQENEAINCRSQRNRKKKIIQKKSRFFKDTIKEK